MWENDPTPFIRYMLPVILACYTEFEERVGLMSESVTAVQLTTLLNHILNKKSASSQVRMQGQVVQGLEDLLHLQR